jgi:hypothetical protein
MRSIIASTSLVEANEALLSDRLASLFHVLVDDDKGCSVARSVGHVV